MAQFSFSKKFNTKKLFNIETENFEYVSLEELYTTLQSTEHPELPLIIKGVYINDKGLFEPAPVLAIDGCYVNLPAHLTDTCRQIINDPVAVVAINQGKCGFIIEEYIQKKYNRTCYTIEFVDL